MNKTISFEISSGSRGYKPALAAAINFAKANPDIKLILFAKKSDKAEEQLPSNIELRYSERTVDYHASIMDTLRDSDNAFVKAIESVQNGESMGIVSPASSAHLTAIGYMKYKGYNREIKPVFAPLFSNFEGQTRIVLDVGANLSYTAHSMVQYGIMGSELAKSLKLSDNPKIALLNIGEENDKGEPWRVEAFNLLKEHFNERFIGNVEADDAMTKQYDVLVTDAVVGNTTLKAYESSFSKFIELIKKSSKTWRGKLGLLLLKDSLIKDLKKMANSEMGGGAIVLGINKLVIKAHGGSKEQEFYNSLRVAKMAIDNNLVENLKAKFENATETHHNHDKH